MLVNSTIAHSVVVVPQDLPAPLDAVTALRPSRADRAVYARLATVLHKPKQPKPCKVPEPPPSCNTTTRHCPGSTKRRLSEIACTVAQQIALSPYADATVGQAVGTDVEYYIAERANRFRGVAVQQTSITGYPDGELAAQTLGTVGRLTPAQHLSKAFKGVNPNAVVGQSGLESQYDAYLRGTFGEQRVQIDAAGQPTGRGKTIQPRAGENLKTSLDAPLEKVGQASLQQSMGLNASPGGAFVAMNPDTGAVYALGSLPSFNPKVFTKPFSQGEYDRLNSTAAGQPLFNRAISSVGPTGSTFKPITATAALESHLWTVDRPFDDTGQFCTGGGYCRKNSGGASYGDVNLESALQVSDDVYFYHLGAITNADPITHPRGGPLQTWARKFGIGERPDIDLPRSQVSAGNLPDPKWREAIDRQETMCENAAGPYKYSQGNNFSPTPKKGYKRSTKISSCGIADGRPWSIGDNVSLAVGQGDVLVSPLQLAVAYSAIANGGNVVRPHIGESIQDADGTVVQTIDPKPARHINIDPSYLSAIKTGLNEAAQSQGGTSDDVMGDFGMPVYGKTGTAQYFTATQAETDYGWYSCFVPAGHGKPPIEVVVWVEKGGFGDVAAAPVARQILSQWFYGTPGPYKAGNSHSL